MRFSQSTYLLFLPLETLPSIITTGLPILVELNNLVNSVIIFLSQMTLLRWLTFLLGYQTDTSTCSAMAFSTWGNSDHVAVSVSIDFPSNSQQDAPYHCIAYDYSHADSDGLRDHLRDIPWEDFFKFGVSAAASEFYEWVQDGIDVYIPHSLTHLYGFQLLVLLA